MSRTFFLIAIGGALGSIGRIVSQQFAQRYFPFDFPVGTIAVNIVGSFVIGLVFGLSDHRHFFSPQTRLFLTAGLCGGFTTFSSFSYETLNLIRTGEFIEALLYIGVSIVSGLAAAAAGYYMIR